MNLVSMGRSWTRYDAVGRDRTRFRGLSFGESPHAPKELVKINIMVDEM